MSEHTLKTLKEACKEEEECWDAGAIWKQIEGFEKKMRIKYAKLCENRIHDMKADAVATFIEEEIFGQEPEEILGGVKSKP